MNSGVVISVTVSLHCLTPQGSRLNHHCLPVHVLWCFDITKCKKYSEKTGSDKQLNHSATFHYLQHNYTHKQGKWIFRPNEFSFLMPK